MTKQLLLIRHAQASESAHGQKDFDRTLTSKGIIDASQLGMHLMKKSLHPDAIFSSSALRARVTATTIAEKINFDVNKIKFDKQLYESSPRSLLNLVNGFKDHWKRVFIVGHNPVITYFAEYLTGNLIDNMSPASMAVIMFDLPSWKEASAGLGDIDVYYNPQYS